MPKKKSMPKRLVDYVRRMIHKKALQRQDKLPYNETQQEFEDRTAE